jgi:hypothetical protein
VTKSKTHAVDRKTVAAIAREAAADAAALRAGATDLPPAPVIAELGRVKLRELDGNETALKTLWKDRPAALVFLRHYG